MFRRCSFILFIFGVYGKKEGFSGAIVGRDDVCRATEIVEVFISGMWSDY